MRIELTAMTRLFLSLLAVWVACAGLAACPSKQSADRRTSTYNSVKGYLIRAATARPEEDDSFKPAPDICTFGELLGHTADHQMSLCSTAGGARKQGDASSKTTGAD